MKYNFRERFNTHPDAIFFDIDNTLYAYNPAHCKGLQQVVKKASALYMIDEKEFSEAFIEARSQIKAHLGHTASGHSRLLYYQRTLELLGLGSQVLSALDFEQTYWRAFLLEAKLFDGALETFSEIRRKGIPLVLVTDLTAQIQMRKIVYFGLDKYIDFLITSEESGADKVSGASYELALRKIGVSNGLVWMVGDNPENDITGAKRAINAVTLQKLHKGVKTSADHKPDAAFRDFRELTTLIAALGAQSD